MLALFHDQLTCQQYVSGDDSANWSFHAFADSKGRVIHSFTGRKIRTFPPDNGESAYIELAENEELRVLGARLAACIPLKGIFKMDFKQDARTGRWYLLEVNARFNLRHYLGAVNGVNLMRTAYDFRWVRLIRVGAAATQHPLALLRARLAARALRAGAAWHRRMARLLLDARKVYNLFAERCRAVARFLEASPASHGIARPRTAPQPLPPMALYGVLGDIHGNREALVATLERIDAIGVDRMLCVGDVIGYNADPDECVRLLQSRDVLCIAGNHDLIGTGQLGFERCSNKAMHSLKRTRRTLGESESLYVRQLPSHVVLEEKVLLTHGGVRDVQQYMTRPKHFLQNAKFLRQDFPESGSVSTATRTSSAWSRSTARRCARSNRPYASRFARAWCTS